MPASFQDATISVLQSVLPKGTRRTAGVPQLPRFSDGAYPFCQYSLTMVSDAAAQWEEGWEGSIGGSAW